MRLLFVFVIYILHLTRSLSTHNRNAEMANAIIDISLFKDDFKGLEKFMEKKRHEDSLPVPDMIHSYGYKCEIHEYTTDDGYINTLHKILPRNDKNQKFNKHQTVFLQHGLLGTSADYVMGSPEKSLGYLLADMGYEVWMGNARGNAYSRKHVNLTIDSEDYWKFSFDEMGKYDLPAALRYVLKNQNPKNSKELFYIGHSMGTVMFWVAMNEHQDFMTQTVKHMFAMGPVATVTHIESPIAKLAPLTWELEELFKWLGINEFEPSNAMMQLFNQYACEMSVKEMDICENVLFLLTGFDREQMNMTMLPIILGHEPGGTSTRTMIHFAQEVESGKFQKFDYGRRDNKKFYNQTHPPVYDLRKVTVPVTLLWSHNDWLADPKDVKELFALPKLDLNYEVPNSKFNHIDFIWGLDAKELVWNKIFEQMEQIPK